MNVDEQALRFIKNLVQLYFNNLDPEEFSKNFEKEKISWIGADTHEICMNFKEVSQQLIETQNKSYNNHLNFPSPIDRTKPL